MKKTACIFLVSNLTLPLSPNALYAAHEAGISKKKDEPVVFNPMVISATLSDKSIEEIPGTLHLFDKEKIRLRNVRRAGDILQETPGVYIWGASQGSQAPSANRGNRISIRGVSGVSRTLVLLDNQKMNDPAFGTFNWATLFPEDIERIEVIPGAASALYGGNAFAGVIRVVSKKPTEKEISLTGGYQFNSPESGYGSAVYRDVFDNGLAISIGYRYETSSGYRDSWSFSDPATNQAGPQGTRVTGAIPTHTTNGTPTFQIGDRGNVPWNYHVGQIKAYYDFSPTTRISGGLRYLFSDVRSENPTSYLRDPGGNTVISGTVNVGGTILGRITPSLFLNAETHEDDLRSFLDFEHEFANHSKLSLSFNHLSRGYWSTLVGQNSTFDGGPGTSAHRPQQLINGQGMYSFHLGDRHFLTTGFQVEHGTLKRREYTLSNWQDIDSRTALNLTGDSESLTTSFFVQDEIFLTDRLTAYFGTRLDWWTAEGKSRNLQTGVVKPTEKQSVVEISPKLALVYQAPWQGGVLRASAGRAFRPPTLQDMFADSRRGVVINYANASLKPETALSWEAGIEQHLAATGTRLKATFFENRLFDLITSKNLTFTTTLREATDVNAGTGITRGIELSVDQVLTGWLKLHANYTWTPTARTLKNSASPDSEGKRMPNSSKHILTAGLETNWHDWSGSLTGRHVSKSFNTAENIDVFHNVYGGNQAFWLLDTKLIYTWNKMAELSFAANNLLNERYFQSLISTGRNYVAQVNLRF
ncbi:TonB-dependent receptor [Nitrosomonas europaea]|uniref:TonB-dependent receptor n=1 Tax=Nitrosomonas europaea TaxID=915 RepID=UPI00079A19A4|nr:TonB-dependent receptor [Nitrosomonas europaea]KXK42205.1 MAG: TonB-dependent receptor protein [Nitrosomonas europaea]